MIRSSNRIKKEFSSGYAPVPGGGQVLRDPRYGPKTVENASEYLSYDPETGHFTRLKSRQQQSVGTRAGSKTAFGYRTVSVLGVTFDEHVLAWMFGHPDELPKGKIRHRNGVRDDNRLENLYDWVGSDDMPRGVFYRATDDLYEVRLRTRGSNGRRSFGVFKDREQALQVAATATSMLGKGIDARRVRSNLKLLGMIPEEEAADVASTRDKQYPALYQATEIGGETLWFVRRLRQDRYANGAGYPIYGPFKSKEEAQEKVIAYYNFRDSMTKMEALEAAGITVARVFIDSDGIEQVDVAKHGYFPRQDGGSWPEALVEKLDSTGRVRYLIPHLPYTPTEMEYSMACLGELSLDKTKTWEAATRYVELRGQGADHEDAMDAAGLGYYGMMGDEAMTFASIAEAAAGDGRIVPFVAPEGNTVYKIVDLRRRDYGPFLTEQEAKAYLATYRDYAQFDSKFPNHTGHKNALNVSGLVKREMPV